MDDEERLEGEEEMDLDEASDGEDEDEETSGIPVSPANSDQLLGSTPTPGNYIITISKIVILLFKHCRILNYVILKS